jgi:hypothetical protein
MHPDAAAHVCRMTWPRLEYLKTLESRARLSDALVEIRDMDEGMQNLGPEHRAVLEHGDAIRNELRRMPTELAFFQSMVLDLHVAYHRFQGGTVPKRAQQRLRESLEDLSELGLDDLIETIQATA